MSNKIFEYAKEKYQAAGVNVEEAIKRVASIPVSVHCWQGDDVRGFENAGAAVSGGIATTGNYPGRARDIDELRADIHKAFSYIPGIKRLSLHAIYLDNLGQKVERNKIEPKHFDSWLDWAKQEKINLDFNPTYFSHPMAESGFTLSSPDEKVRNYWIEHGIASRKIAEYIGKKQGSTVLTNHWTPDGFKDIPVDRYAARARLEDSYDKVFAEKIDKKYNLDAVESKVFGLGVESCTIGSHEFYMGYALKNDKLITLDAGHFHPTEVISDKLSSMMLFLPDLLLHVSRPVRWDSDHVVILDDELKAIACEVLRNNFDKRINIALDYFDASINRIAAWAIGARNMQKALLMAALEPTAKLKKFELEGDFTSRLVLLEEYKTYPFEAIWNEYCDRCGVIAGEEWFADVKKYEKDVLSLR